MKIFELDKIYLAPLVNWNEAKLVLAKWSISRFAAVRSLGPRSGILRMHITPLSCACLAYIIILNSNISGPIRLYFVCSCNCMELHIFAQNYKVIAQPIRIT